MIGLLDLPSLRYHERVPPTLVQGRVSSLAFHGSGGLIVSANVSPPGWSPRSTIYILDPELDEVVATIRRGVHDFYFPQLRTDAAGEILYYAEQGLSTVSIGALDVRDPRAPAWLEPASWTPGQGLANVRQLLVSRFRDRVYSAQGWPYGLQVFTAPDRAYLGLLTTGPYPAAVAEDHDGGTLFVGTSNVYNDRLYQFDAATGELLRAYPLQDEIGVSTHTSPQGVAVAGSLQKVFIVHGLERPGGAGIEKVQVLRLRRSR